jgi:cytochrome c oxidase cbb3-type subunit III
VVPVLILLLSSLAWSQSRNPFAGNAVEAEQGRGTFRIRCAPCHGIHAQGGRGPDLTLGFYNNGNTDDALYRVIAHGVPGTEMPGYVARMGPENVWRVVTYLRSITTRTQTPPSGDRAAGEAFYWGKGGCGQCHRVGSRGGVSGPDLTRIGRKRSLTHLTQSIVKPNADLTPGFYKLTATMATGKLTGVQRGFDNFSCQLVTLDGKLHSFDRTLVPCERENVSIMPAYNLSEADLNNLLTYLASLRGE